MYRPLADGIPALRVNPPAWSEEYPGILFKRAKGERLYDIDGNRYLDFHLEGGRLPFGHAPSFLTQAVKNSISLGDLRGLPGLALARFHAALRSSLPILPEYDLYFVPDLRAARAMLRAAYPGWEPLRPETLASEQIEGRIHALRGNGTPLLIDEGDSFHTCDADSAVNRYQPEAAILEGVLRLPILLLRPGHALSPVAWIPEQFRLVQALAVLRAVRGPRAPYGHLAALSDRFRQKYKGPVSGRRGINPIIELTAEDRSRLLREGFHLGPAGIVHFCTGHTEKAVDRLAAALYRIKKKDQP